MPASIRLLAGALLLCILPWALAVYSPEDIAHARRAAVCHLELRIDSPEPTRTQPGQVLVRAHITHVYRSRGAHAVGQQYSFWVDSIGRDQRAPPGDDVRLLVDDLAPGTFIAGYFNDRTPAGADPANLALQLRQVDVYPVSSPKAR